MKSAYELAMERLNRQSPSAAKPLNAEQKRKIADLDSLYRAKIAEKEIALKPAIEEARFGEDPEKLETLEKGLREAVRALREEMEREKEKVRAG
ncbi:MAG: hypothetical protein IT578_01955 [Verrucomicrobiae bacterium]|nr:hypothetical protein [Verrucomicrobiae bacterium]